MNPLAPHPLTPESNAVQHYLDALQNVISRMASNSATCKNWCVTIVSAIVVIVADKGSPSFVWIALIPILLFGFLDAYYLAQERGFRATYQNFVNRLHSGHAIAIELFYISPQPGFSIAAETLRALSSFSIYPFYITLIGMLILGRLLVF
jgi:hypothetical protein